MRPSFREMHHRVKNNLQTIAMLLRLQMGQKKELSPRAVLNETINRVLSIATVHEILSEDVTDTVDTLDLIKRVARTISGNMVNPAANIDVSVEGGSGASFLTTGNQPGSGGKRAGSECAGTRPGQPV